MKNLTLHCHYFNRDPLLRLCRGSVFLAMLLLSSCMNIDLAFNFTPDEQLQNQIVNQQQDLFPHINPIELNDDIREFVDTYIQARDTEEIRVEKLQTLLFDDRFMNIQYSSDRTQTAEEVFISKSGNCLSVMNLYVAMARYAGVNANFQTVEVQPSWDRRGGLLILNQHINATGRFSVRRHYVVDFTPEIALQQMTAQVITDKQARALYFNNLGVEQLIEGDYQQSLVYFKNALWLNADLSITWNNIGANYSRLGRKDLAEYSYRKAFSLDEMNATAVNNLAKYYADNGDMEKANEYRLAISRFTDQNPYYHFARGNVAFENNDFDNARVFYQRALRLKGVEPDFYYALARTYQALGDNRRARQQSELAETLLAQEGIYQPSDDKIRIFDSSTILRDSSPGMSIFPPGAKRKPL